MAEVPLDPAWSPSGDAIARAMAAIHADPHLSIPATYAPPGGGGLLPMRVVWGFLDQDTGAGGSQVRQTTVILEALRSAFPGAPPAKDGVLTAGQDTYRVFEVRADDTRLVWRMFCRAVPA